MRTISMLPACLTVALLACTSENGPTQPDIDGNLVPATPSLGLARNTWTPRAPAPFSKEFFGYSLGVAPNSAGQSIVYTFGGTDGEGGTGFGIRAYNVATNTWTGRLSRVFVFDLNGVGKIGSRLYFSGGDNDPGSISNFENSLWAYDYVHDRMIGRADMPIFSGEGQTGVIDGKLYVLPGTCSGNGYPYPGFCAEEPTRRFYRYDPAKNTWVTRRQVPHFHRKGAAAVIDGKFYVVGGFHGFQPVADLDVYDPVANTWRTLAPIPTAGLATGAALNGQFYVVVHRFNGTSPEIRAYAYNRVTNQWKAKAAPAFYGPVTRVMMNGRAYLFTASGDYSALYTP